MANSFDSRAYVEQASRLCQLPISNDDLPGVVENMEALAHVADLVMSFPLPETVEAAPTFDPLPAALSSAEDKPSS